jgi:DNA-binding NarL/FixJ family response regulator
MSMVGRAEELGELRHAWARVAARRRGAGHPVAARTVVVTGVAGVGKSRLVAEALAVFAPRPLTVLSGAARLHTPAPYDWLAAVLGGRDRRGLPVPPDALAWLTQDRDAPAERYAPAALLRLAVQTVRALVGEGPGVVVVEDLHALDPASLNLVGELAATPDLPALLVVTGRPPDAAVSPQLAARTLARLAGSPGAVRQHLRPLDPAGVAAVLSQAYGNTPVSPSLARAVWERTGGNPYWLTELIAAAGGTEIEALAGHPVPEHVLLSAGPAEAAVGSTAPAETAELTAREVEVLACLASGMSNKQVARSLGISIRTVAVHVSNLLRKTGSASRTEAALWAVRNQFDRVSAPSAPG